MRLKNQPLMYFFTVTIAFGSFIFGYSLVCISMMSDHIHKANPMTDPQFDVQLSTITTLLPFGAFIGTQPTHSGVFLADPLCRALG